MINSLFMKKGMLFTLAMAAGMSLWAQEKPKQVILPGKGKLDIEQFYKHIDTKMDLSRLSLAELRVLRNGFAARKGYIFKEADLRSIYAQTSWYDSITWERMDNPQTGATLTDDPKENYGQPPLKLLPAEQAFVDRIRQQEARLLREKAQPAKGHIVNLDLLLNPFQLEEFDPRLQSALARNGFAIVPDTKLQLFHIYEKNDYTDFPSFVTTDLYLQLFHFYFDNVLRDVEERRLDSLTTLFCQGMFNRMTELLTRPRLGAETRRAAEYAQAYFAIALTLETGRVPAGTRPAYRRIVEEEVARVNRAENTLSEFLGYPGPVLFPYSLFRPRGHYTRSARIQRYFRTMMWLQTVPFGTDKPNQLKRAALLAWTIGRNEKMQRLYNQLFEPMTYLFGEPDDITIPQVYTILQGLLPGGEIEWMLSNSTLMADLRTQVEQLSERQTHIRPKFEATSRHKINLMPQRYMPDAEVLNEMVDSRNDPAHRAIPAGLDVFAALGCPAAERILLDEREEDRRWEGFRPTLDSMRVRMGQIDWQQTLATRWIDALREMNRPVLRAPYFMQTSAWEKKNLNTALASWAELKHDAILYAKQPMGAECGSGGPPEPVVKGYVEPNVAFWSRAVALTEHLDSLLRRFDLMTDKARRTTERVREMAEFLLNVSRKELAGTGLLDDEEYKSIEIIGSQCENISLDLARNDEEYLSGWDDVSGADKSVAIVADVYTANAPNNPNPSILYEATGPAHQLYVVVPIGGEFYLMRGAVLSYREFEQSIDEPRLTDEEWQERLHQKPLLGLPRWMNDILVPLEQQPADNEEIFYSSGC